MNINRRKFHKASGAVLLAYAVGGDLLLLSPAKPQEQKVPYQILTEEEAGLLELLSEAIVPDAQKSGISHYIDHQLAAPKADNMLILKYLGVPHPQVNFYRQALLAFKKSCPLFQKKNITDVTASELQDYVKLMIQQNPPDWHDAPPAPFFYFTLRSDAIDVTYGTMEGFSKLNIPYMAHIEPAGKGWA